LVMQALMEYTGPKDQRLQKIYMDILSLGLQVKDWSDYSKMRFEASTPFVPDRWAEWG
jgi:hypothetical protein